MNRIEILHNPRCSKSRQTLALLEGKGLSPVVRLYLEDTPTTDELREILIKLDMTPRELLRKGEQDYKDNGLADTSLDDTTLLKYLHDYPKLIERPIVIHGNKAAIGRPPEQVLDIL